MARGSTAGLGASSPCGACSLPNWQAGPAMLCPQRITPSLSCYKQGCSSLMSGLQLMLSVLLQLLCSPLPALLNRLFWLKPAYLYPQPARRFMQIAEVSAPICRAAVSQAFPLPFSAGGEAGHSFKLLTAAKRTLQLWVEIRCSGELRSPQAGCRVWWE